MPREISRTWSNTLVARSAMRDSLPSLASSGGTAACTWPQVQHQRDQLLLGAVVQITLDPPPGLIGSGDDPRA